VAYVDREELRRTLAVPSGADYDVDLDAACAAATTTIDKYCGQSFPEPVPAGVHIAALQLASRFYRADDVAFGTFGSDLGSTFTGRWLTPEIEALLLGKRVTFGIA